MMPDFLEGGLARNFVAGRWTEGDDGARLAVEDPATEKVVADCALAGPKTVDAAVTAARTTADRGTLSHMRPSDRAGLLRRIATEIRGLKADGGITLCLESGKTLNDSNAEFEEAAQYFEYYGGLADKFEGKSIPLGPDYVDFTIYEPQGVSAQIVPWNYPVSLAARSLAPALAVGNCVVIKSPELDPIALQMLGVALERAEVPEGAVSIIAGHGHEAGAALVSHPGVNQIVFTGSVPTGRSILRAAAETVTPCLMELGGKSAAVVFPDADLDNLIASVKMGIFSNAGQICSAMSRLIVEKSRYADVLERVANLAKSLSVGHGKDNPDLTPVISGAQLERIELITSRARQDGASVIEGGKRLDREGHFMAPTVLANVSPDAYVAQEEIFGPVICLIPFSGEEEAWRIANGTRFGLVAGVFTKEIDRAIRGATRLKAGQVFINEWFAGGIQTPFGGVGQSGYGREKGVDALLNYVRTKNIAIRLHA